MKNKGTRNKIFIAAAAVLVCGWVIFVFSNSMQTPQASLERSVRVLPVFENVMGKLGVPESERLVVVRKGAHVFEYAVLGVLLYWCVSHLTRVRSWRNVCVTLCAALVVAAADESIQHFISGRDGRPTDVLIDLCGAALGSLLMQAVYSMTRKSVNDRIKHGCSPR